MRFFYCLPLVLSLILGNSTLPAQTNADMRTLVQGNNAFAFDLFRQFGAKEGNVFFSPYSISSSLAMTYAGARGNTERQMAKALHFYLPQETLHPGFAGLQKGLNALQDSGRVRLAIANSLWPQQEFQLLPDYLNLATQYYEGTITPVDYRLEQGEAARRMINSWVEQKTQNKIKELIPSGVLNAMSSLTLVNAIYFKGSWQTRFEKKFTRDAPFYINSQEEIQAPLMYQRAKFPYAEIEDFQIIELPYAGDGLSMIVLLPPKGTPLSTLESKLAASHIDMWKSRLQTKTVDLFLHRFTATQEFSLARMLAELGMADAFDPGRANFSGMVGDREQLNISDVLHKAFVDVSEEGTEAAAATAVGMTLIRSTIHGSEPVPVFRADHPFIFLIQEKKTGSILFLGRVVNPRE